MSAKGQKSSLVTSKRDKTLTKKKSTTLLLPEGTYNLANNRRNSLEDGTESSSDGECQRKASKTKESLSARGANNSDRSYNNLKTSNRFEKNERAAEPKKKSPFSYIDYRVYINDRYIQMDDEQERRDSISKLKLKDEYERSNKYRTTAPAFNYFNSSNTSSPASSSRSSDEVDETPKTRRSMSAAPISLFPHHRHHHFSEHRNSTASYNDEAYTRPNRYADNLEDLSASFNDSIFIQSVNHFKRPINI